MLPPALATGLLWLTTEYPVTPYEVALSLGLLYIPWISFLRWRQRPQFLLPIFALISGMYWLYFSLALFWGTWERVNPPIRPEASYITTVLLMVAVGMGMLFLGMQAAGKFIRGRTIFPETQIKPSQWVYVDGVLVVGLVGSRFVGMGGDARQFFFLLFDFIPLVAFALLFRKFLAGRAITYEKFLLGGFVLARLVLGLGWGGWERL